MIFISLGVDCMVKTALTELNYIKRKNEGGHTNVFDLTIHPYMSVIHFIENNFRDYLQIKNVIINEENLVCDQIYNVVYVHESPSFAQIKYDLNWYLDEKYSKEHFINENYTFLKERYDNRIKNFYKDAYSDDTKIFLHHTKTNEHCAVLYDLLTKKFNDVHLIVLNTAKTKIYDNVIKPNYEFHNLDIEDDWHSSYKNKEKIRLWLFSIISNVRNKIKLCEMTTVK
jgi:hypothetical protein